MSLPSFIIVGAQKGGTIAASHNLSLHPEIDCGQRPIPSTGPELHYYDTEECWALGPEWYQSKFNSVKPVIGDDNPDLLHLQHTHQRIHDTIPDAKVIVLLRNPITRAYSHWNHWANSSTQNEPWRDQWRGKTFMECWEQFPELAWRGHYAEHLRSLRHYFVQEQVYIGISERIWSNMEQGYAPMFQFLGVPQVAGLPYRAHHTRRYASIITEAEVQHLTTYYKTINADLFDLLDSRVEEWNPS